jgi:DNA-binding XRE family transcriptional regulator
MTQRTVPAAETFAKWWKDPEYVVAYDSLEQESALADALIKARIHADMSQEDVAQAMGITQPMVARLEGGRSKPSIGTLERFAKATHTRLHIVFEPEAPVHPRLFSSPR